MIHMRLELFILGSNYSSQGHWSWDAELLPDPRAELARGGPGRPRMPATKAERTVESSRVPSSREQKEFELLQN